MVVLKGFVSGVFCFFWCCFFVGCLLFVLGRFIVVLLLWLFVFVLVSVMDKVFIEGLMIDVLIGIYDWE